MKKRLQQLDKVGWHRLELPQIEWASEQFGLLQIRTEIPTKLARIHHIFQPGTIKLISTAKP